MVEQEEKKNSPWRQGPHSTTIVPIIRQYTILQCISNTKYTHRHIDEKEMKKNKKRTDKLEEQK
jgi:hypothetical protein